MMGASYTLIPVLVLLVAAVLTGVLVLVISNRRKKQPTQLSPETNGNESILEDVTPPLPTSGVLKLALKYIGYNLLAGLLVALPLIFLKNSSNDGAITWLFAMLIIGLLSLLIQLIIAIVWAAGRTKKQMGKALLLAVGLFFLIGLFTCGPFLFRGF
jgi:hypothetical protein